MSKSLQPHGLYSPSSLSMRFSRQEYWSGLPFPIRGSSQPRDWTQVSCVSCIGRLILYHYATLEAQFIPPAAAAKSRQSCPTLCNPIPHRRQPTRLPCPWDSPGKNTGVDCHFLLNSFLGEQYFQKNGTMLLSLWEFTGKPIHQQKKNNCAET